MGLGNSTSTAWNCALGTSTAASDYVMCTQTVLPPPPAAALPAVTITGDSCYVASHLVEAAITAAPESYKHNFGPGVEVKQGSPAVRTLCASSAAVTTAITRILNATTSTTSGSGSPTATGATTSKPANDASREGGVAKTVFVVALFVLGCTML